MKPTDFSMNFLNFSPNTVERNNVHLICERILTRAPSDATIRLHFEKTRHGILGQATVRSSAGQFEAIERAKDVSKVMVRLESNLKKQLKRWRRLRFISHAPAC